MIRSTHDDVIKWKHFPRNWPFVRGIHRSRWIPHIPTQRPVTRIFDVFFDLRLNKRLSKQPWCWWFETLSWSLWRHCNIQLKFRLFNVKRFTCWRDGGNIFLFSSLIDFRISLLSYWNQFSSRTLLEMTTLWVSSWAAMVLAFYSRNNSALVRYLVNKIISIDLKKISYCNKYHGKIQKIYCFDNVQKLQTSECKTDRVLSELSDAAHCEQESCTRLMPLQRQKWQRAVHHSLKAPLSIRSN